MQELYIAYSKTKVPITRWCCHYTYRLPTANLAYGNLKKSRAIYYTYLNGRRQLCQFDTACGGGIIVFS